MTSGSDLFNASDDNSGDSVTILSAATIIGQQALQILQTAGNFVPIPGIALAAGIALQILDASQAVKSNKDDFISIGRDACAIVTTVIQRIDAGRNEHALANRSALERDADQLVADLKIIKKTIKKHAKRSLVKRVFYHQADQETIDECRRQIHHALSLFGLQSDIEMRQMLAALSGQMAELLQKTSQTSQMPQPQIPQQFASYSQQPASFPQQPAAYPQQPASYLQQPASYQPQKPTPQAVAPHAPAPYRSERSEARAERRRKRHEMQMHQIQNPPPSTPFPFSPPVFNNSFQYAQNYVAPNSNAAFHTHHGDYNNITTDNSVNVTGSGNSVSIG